MQLIRLICIVLLASFISYAQNHFGGPVPLNKCQEESDHKSTSDNNLLKSPLSVSFSDPMGGSGTNGFGQTLINYFDLDPSSALQDYNCGTVTYNGHRGTDIEILSFYEMDEGVPVLCAAPGEVIYVHDGEYDRRTSWQSGVMANQVSVQHDDGLVSIYLHFKQNSIRVSYGQQVQTGDTLGLIGSSGYSSNPHLHFEVKKDGLSIDPFSGTCQPGESLWQEQLNYVSELPFDVMDNGLTTVNLDWPTMLEKPPRKTHAYLNTLLRSWVRLRNAKSTDKLTWKVYRNDGTIFWDYSFYPSGSWSSSWWYVYFTLPETTTHMGEWRVEIFHNDIFVTEQSFIRVNQPNQEPVINDTSYVMGQDEIFRGILTAKDPDGAEMFWYMVSQKPKHGVLTLFGGRDRKFSYRPSPGFNGMDTAYVSAEDDERLKGEPGQIVFKVGNTTTIRQNNPNLKSFILFANYPNPFNPETKIRYELKKKSNITLTVHDISGRRIKTLINGIQPSGNYKLNFNAASLSGGIYFYRLTTAEGFTESRKMILLK